MPSDVVEHFFSFSRTTSWRLACAVRTILIATLNMTALNPNWCTNTILNNPFQSSNAQMACRSAGNDAAVCVNCSTLGKLNRPAESAIQGWPKDFPLIPKRTAGIQDVAQHVSEDLLICDARRAPVGKTDLGYYGNTVELFSVANAISKRIQRIVLLTEVNNGIIRCTIDAEIDVAHGLSGAIAFC